MINPKVNSIKLNETEYLRYSKQISLKSISHEGQKRIKKSKILVIGAGGLSCPIMMYLTGSGIEHIGIIDSDKIEISNLNRQILYYETDINKLKVQCARSQLNKINRICKIITHPYRLDNINSKEIIKYYDLIIDTSDNFKTRKNIYQACYKLSKTYIYGAVDNFIGQTSVFNYKDGIQYSDIYSSSIDKDRNCNINGIMGITTSYLGTLQAIETIKIITGYKQKLNNSIILCNLIDSQIKISKIYKNKTYRKIESINNQKYVKIGKINRNALYKNKTTIIIDVRNNKEFTKKHIKKSINLPLESFKSYKTLKFLKKHEYENSLLLYCNQLRKSILISSLLQLNKIEHSMVKDISKLA